jgi:hypothetical protein
MTPETGRSLRPSPADERLLSLRLRRPPQVVSREAGEWLMLIDVDTGFTYEANWLGAQVWRLLGEGHSVAEACTMLRQGRWQAREVIEREAIEREVVAFVRDLLAYGLVGAESAAMSPAPL